jgi:glycosyltransferase involved in cell wall biosynthesis
VAVLPYADATQSGALQLAFGYGLPVVTTRVGGLAEVVDDGETGFLVPPGDPPALAAAVARYFGQGLGPIFRANVQARKDRFSWDHLVATIEELARP